MNRKGIDINWSVNESEVTPPSTSFTGKERYIDYHNIQGSILACASILFSFLAVYFTSNKLSEINTSATKKETTSIGVSLSVELDHLKSIAQSISNLTTEKPWFQSAVVNELGFIVLTISPTGLFDEINENTQITEKLKESEKDFLDFLFIRHFLADPDWNFIIIGNSFQSLSLKSNNSNTRSNWEIAASQTALLANLLQTSGFYHRQIRQVSLADTKPLVPTNNIYNQEVPENIVKNQRIEILVGKNLKAMLEQL